MLYIMPIYASPHLAVEFRAVREPGRVPWVVCLALETCQGAGVISTEVSDSTPWVSIFFYLIFTVHAPGLWNMFRLTAAFSYKHLRGDALQDGGT